MTWRWCKDGVVAVWYGGVVVLVLGGFVCASEQERMLNAGEKLGWVELQHVRAGSAAASVCGVRQSHPDAREPYLALGNLLLALWPSAERAR